MDGRGHAQDLAEVLGTHVFDLYDAARLLGIRPATLQYAAYRHRVSYVQYGAAKFFALGDLIEYGVGRGRGKASRLARKEYFIVKPAGWVDH
jgi:hypothetical protein